MSNLLNNILSDIDPSVTSKSPASATRQAQAPASVPRPGSRPGSFANGVPQALPLKRKADGQPDGGHIKIQRKEDTIQAPRTNSSARPTPPSDVAKAKASTSANPIPYRGTVRLGGPIAAKPSNPVVKKPSTTGSTPASAPKPTAPAPKTAGNAPSPGAAPAPAKKGSYAAMLQRAKEVQQAKPVAPPMKHEPTKILTKKERLALRAEASAMKGKKPSSNGAAGLAKGGVPKADMKEKRKPPELGYQGTARPTKKPVEIGYKGTARSNVSVAGPAGKAAGPVAAKAKPKPKKPEDRWGGYARWSDIEDEEEEEEEGYDSDASSDMEGGMWDMEQEEALALKAAKKEDAEALAEEERLKLAKEERKRKLLQLSKNVAAKKKY